ncbi:unnamed protein product [Spodoptera littoralis]|uniref:Uncharacterized protein n=1 Tax=Spodoptera littoralis TaxID=7109 RepID=A0A9P0N1K6_SPOLI|nr:unnamed protein product [Spodoptera littoralis]CAH1636535.1 unnamed protein product [Spodoptera littoralis]
MFQSKAIILSSAILVLCGAAAVFDKINKKCDFTDDECLQGLYFGLIGEATENGISELDVPKLDPFELKDKQLPILGMINIIISHGTVNGFKNCVGSNVHNDVESLRIKVTLICENFAINGKYKIEVTPVLKALIGTIDIHGDGQGSIVVVFARVSTDRQYEEATRTGNRSVAIDCASRAVCGQRGQHRGIARQHKVKLDLEIAYEIKKNENADIRFVLKPEDTTYEFEFLDKVTFGADSVFIGSQDISNVVTNVLNENWEFIAKSFARSVIDLAMTIFSSNAQKVLDALPVKDLYNTDLTHYVKN